MAEGKKSFTMYVDFIHVLNKLTNEQAGKLFKAILLYYNEQEYNIIDEKIKLAFDIAIDANKEKLSSRETYVYHIRLTNENDDFIKIGISYFLDKRYNDFESHGFKVEELFVEKFSTRFEAIQKEKYYHEQFKQFRFIPTIKFCGYTECFSIELLNLMDY